MLALGEIGSEKTVGRLKKSFETDPATRVRIASAKALSKIGGRQAVTILLKGLRNTSYQVGRAATLALGVIGDPSATSPLVQLAQIPNRPDYYYMDIIYALDRIGGDEALKALKDMADNHPGTSVRKIAKYAFESDLSKFYPISW